MAFIGRTPPALPGIGDPIAPDRDVDGADRAQDLPHVVPMHTPDARRLLGLVDTHRAALPGPIARDVPDAVNVSTGRFAIITRHTPAQVLQTAGAAPCVVVVLHDATHGVAAMAHFHPNQDARRSVDALVAAARRAGLDPARAVAHVAGGRDDAPDLPSRILSALAPHRFTTGARDLLGLEVRAVQFHLRDGRIENYVETGNDQPPAPNDGHVATLERHPRGWRPAR